MKWVNHQVLTGVIVYAATDDMLLTIYSMAGAIFPDKVEGSPRAGNYWSWRRRHVIGAAPAAPAAGRTGRSSISGSSSS